MSSAASAADAVAAAGPARAGGRAPAHPRVDGLAKVTGAAAFASDDMPTAAAHASLVTSRIARGRIAAFDLDAALAAPGVLAIHTWEDMAGEIGAVPHLMAGGWANSSALPLGSPLIRHAGQIVALVVAESPEMADEAARRVVVHYEEQAGAWGIADPLAGRIALNELRKGYTEPSTGDAPSAYAGADASIDAEYCTPVQHHNPIELFTTTCAWDAGSLTVVEPTRYVGAVRHGLARQLGIDPARVRVICPFIGGHFGSRLALAQYTAPVAVAARRLGRPVRLVPTRAQCFTIANHRPETRHRIRIGATAEGTFTALIHDAAMSTSRFDAFAMEGTDVTAALYGCANVMTSETVWRVDRNTPGPMRAPPEVPYLFALESAVDELATRLAIDPIALRRRNDTARDPIAGKPFDRRALMQCFDAGAHAFEWTRRTPRCATMRDGDWLVGLGCASAVRPAKTAPASMRVALDASGRAEVATAHHEIGNGLYTVLAMEAAARLGLPVHAVAVRLGDTALPDAGLSGGSSTTASLLSALTQACENLRARLAGAVGRTSGSSAGRSSDRVRLVQGGLRDDAQPDAPLLPLADAFARLGCARIDTMVDATPSGTDAQALAAMHEGKLALSQPGKSLRWAYGAQFAEVHVHALTGELRVARLMGAFSVGRVVNRLTAISQLRGGMLWGLGSALLEQTEIDTRYGRYLNDNLADYLVPVAADAPERVDALLVDETADDGGSLIGMGETGIIGVNAAIANAVWHATGVRVRRLPIRVDDLIDGLPD
jgi:xanthine dehydrogenase YagR molybdenum-binding subunit